MSGHAQETAIVTETGKGLYQNAITIGPHTLIASEPEDLGGDGSGPTPMELAAAALGACTSITLRMYADRKGWPLEHIRTEVTHKKGPRDVCAEEGAEGPGADRPGLADIFTRTIFMKGDLSPEQRERLLQIAGKCPVHKALSGNACIRTFGKDA